MEDREYEPDLDYEYDMARDSMMMAESETEAIQLIKQYPSLSRYLAPEFKYLLDIKKDNKSGYKGIQTIKLKHGLSYLAVISVDKQRITIGRFNTIEKAYIARQQYITENNLEHGTN